MCGSEKSVVQQLNAPLCRAMIDDTPVPVPEHLCMLHSLSPSYSLQIQLPGFSKLQTLNYNYILYSYLYNRPIYYAYMVIIFFNDKIDQCKNSVGNLLMYGCFYIIFKFNHRSFVASDPYQLKN